MILPAFCPSDLHRAARPRTMLHELPPDALLTQGDKAQANQAGRSRTSCTRLKTARSAVRFRPCPPHSPWPAGYWSGFPRPEATPGSGTLPACPLITATRGPLSPPEHSPATGATPTLLRIVAARLTARSCAAGLRASRSQSGNDRSRRCGGGSGLCSSGLFSSGHSSPASVLVLLTGSISGREARPIELCQATPRANLGEKSRAQEPRTRAADTSRAQRLYQH